MNDLQIFNNEEFGEVRTAVINDEPMFCLADICRVLEIKNVSDCKSRLRQKGIVTTDTLTNGGKQSEAYRDNSIRHKTFSDIWTQLKREYGCVSTYKSIKRKYIDDVHEFIDCYVVPKYLDELIHDANAQQSFA